MENSSRISGTAQDSLQEWIRTDNSPIEVDPTPGDEPSFTFITHNDDLQSKRIRDAAARKQIRSHVMRDVRRRERIAGLRRPSKKERVARVSQNSTGSGSQPIPFPDTPTIVPEDEKDQAEGSLPTAQCPITDRRISLHSLPKVADRTEATARRLQLHSPPPSTGRPEHLLATNINNTPGVRFGDPFGTLPGTAGPSEMVDLLLKHCIEIFLPMTFPVERRNQQLLDIRVQKLMQLQINDVATFYGTMAMTAAHRAMVRGRLPVAGSLDQNPLEIHLDPEYYVMHERALKEINLKMQDPSKALAMDTFLSVMMLVGTATIVGNFEEARLHLDGLVKMTELRQDVLDPGADTCSPFWNMLLTDVKAAAGMGSRPRLRLSNPCESFEESLRHRIVPPPLSGLHRFSRSFSMISALSPCLVHILQGIRDLAFFDDYNCRDPDALDPVAHDIFQHRTLTLEHTLLSYAYEQFPAFPGGHDRLQMPFLESITRAASLMYFSSRFIVAGPKSGLGRALTQQMYDLLLSFDGRCSEFSLQTLELITWVCFISIYGSTGQKEEPYFYSHLSCLLSLVRWRDWSDLERAMQGYLYEPRVFGRSWRAMFDRATTANLSPPTGHK